MVLSERVSEAQRQAVTQLKDMEERNSGERGGRGGRDSEMRGSRSGNGGKRGLDDMDQEEGRFLYYKPVSSFNIGIGFYAVIANDLNLAEMIACIQCSNSLVQS